MSIARWVRTDVYADVFSRTKQIEQILGEKNVKFCVKGCSLFILWSLRLLYNPPAFQKEPFKTYILRNVFIFRVLFRLFRSESLCAYRMLILIYNITLMKLESKLSCFGLEIDVFIFYEPERTFMHLADCC